MLRGPHSLPPPHLIAVSYWHDVETERPLWLPDTAIALRYRQPDGREGELTVDTIGPRIEIPPMTR